MLPSDMLVDAMEALLDQLDTAIEGERTMDQQINFDEDTYTITGGPLKPHEYVVIRREMTAADTAWVQNHATKTAGTAKKPEIQITPGDADLALMQRMIVSWSRTKEDKATGQQVPIPFTPDTIGKMSDRLMNFIKAWINHFNPDTEEIDADFLPNAKGTSETN